MMRRGFVWSLGIAWLLAASAHAQTRAWIDRDPVAVGETTTLNIETHDAGADAPDYSVLERDFDVSGNTSSRQMEMDSSGGTRSSTLYAVALQPKRAGLLTIPSLQVGASRTQSLSLTVTAASVARAGGPVFIEAESDDQTPYVQQAVGYTLRLIYNTPVIAGQLDQDTPDGASLQRIGADKQYKQVIGGQSYTVVERHFLLTPERSGTLTIPGARFEGRGVGGFFDDMFGDGQRVLRANGAPHFLGVRSAPANAPQPWLPLRGLTLRYLSTPQSARAGDATTIEIEARADGATGTQMPDIQLQAVAGAQVFADPSQVDENFDSGRPQVRLTRKFSIVPARAGALRIGGPRVTWWDTRASIARIASLPDINLDVGPGAVANAGNAARAASPAIDERDDASTSPAAWPGRVWPWALGTAMFAMLWLLTLMWGLQRGGGGFAWSAKATAARAGDVSPSSAVPAAGMRDLRHALDAGDLGDVADVLCAMATPRAPDLDALKGRLATTVQRDAIAQLQHARWGNGDAAAARASVRAAFAQGPQWQPARAASATSPLPPLYPES